MNLFYTNTLLISVATVGTILLVARVIDFIISFSVGAIIEKARFKSGKYIPWLNMARFAIYAGQLVLFLPFNMSPAIRYPLIVLGYLLVQIPTAFVTTAQYGTLNIVGGTDMDKRNKMSMLGVRLQTLCSVFTSASTTPLRLWLGNTFGDQYKDFIIAVVYSLFFFVSCGILTYLLKPYDLPSDGSGPARSKITVKDMVKCVVTNDQFIVNMISTLLFFVGMMSPMQIVQYYYIYVRNDPNLLLFAVAQTVAMGVSLFTAMVGPVIGLKLGRKKAMVLGQFMTFGTNVLMILFGHINIYIFITITSLTALATAFYSVFGFSYLIDVAEYGYWKTGIDNRTVTQSLANVPMKIATFVGGSISLYGLAMIGWNPSITFDAAMTTKFMMLYGGIPAICNLLAGFLNAFFYKIGDKEAALYAKENAERAANVQNANA
jgi:Na+/melibiose symporter-like transporter